jgi:outer membrane protein OmpA-like peptidoglycan-associated protein
MIGLRWAPLPLAALAASCATPSLVLLPTEDGKQGAVAVLETDGKPREVVVSELNSRTSLSGRPATKSIDPDKLSAQEQALLDELPPKPVRLTLYFQEGTTSLTKDSEPGLDYLRTEIARRPGAEVQVTGYTDTVGSAEANDELSQRRAEEVLKALVEQGIAKLGMISAVGRGERDLREPTGDDVPSQANRRVVVTVR